MVAAVPTDSVQYIDMDTRYKPEVVYFDGLGQFDWVTSLFGGKPQSWWDRLNGIQNEIAVRLAQITTFPADVWDMIQGRIAQMIREGKSGVPERFPGHAWAVTELESLASKLVATQNHVPSESDISFAERLVTLLGPAISFATNIAPEIRAEVEANAAKVAANLSKAKLRSPEEVGVKVFAEELEKNASAMAGKIGFGGLGIAAIVVAGLLLTSRVRSNPGRRRSRRGKKTKLSDIVPLLVGGAVVGYLAGVFSAAPAISRAQEEAEKAKQKAARAALITSGAA